MSAWAYPALIAHRCGGAGAPENTLAGLEVAAARRFGMVEFDVMLAACGTPVLIHDETLERTTDGAGRVCALTFEALSRVDAGVRFSPRFAGERIPHLEEALSRAAALGLAVNVEIKPAAGFEAETGRVVARCVAARWRGGQPALLSSFSDVALEAARHVAPALRRGVLFEGLSADWRARAEGHGAFSVHCAAQGLTADQVAEVAAAGYPLACYTVNEAAQARRLFEVGVSAIFTDTLAPDSMEIGGSAG